MILALLSFSTMAQDSLFYWNKVEQYRKLQNRWCIVHPRLVSAGIGIALMVDDFLGSRNQIHGLGRRLQSEPQVHLSEYRY